MSLQSYNNIFTKDTDTEKTDIKSFKYVYKIFENDKNYIDTF